MCHCAKTKSFYFRQQKWARQFVTAQFYFVAAIRLFSSGHKHLLWRAEPLLRITATDELLVIYGMKLNNDQFLLTLEFCWSGRTVKENTSKTEGSD